MLLIIDVAQPSRMAQELYVRLGPIHAAVFSVLMDANRSGQATLDAEALSQRSQVPLERIHEAYTELCDVLVRRSDGRVVPLFVNTPPAPWLN